MTVDGRRPPFAWQSRAALEAIVNHYDGSRRSTALAVYTAMTLTASHRLDGEHGGFEATRREVGDLAGVSADTVDRYAKDFATIGVLSIEQRRAGQVNLPNVWTLTEPHDDSPAPPSRTRAATPSRTGAAPLEEELPKNSSSARTREAVDRKAITPDQRRVLDELLRVAAARGVALDEQAALRALLDFPDPAHVHEAVGFADYWMTGAGRNNSMTAVVKAWRNWLRRAKPAPPEQRERTPKPQTWEAAREVVAKAARERRYATTPEFAAEFLRSEGHEAAARWVERVGLGVAAQQASANDPVDFEAANT